MGERYAVICGGGDPPKIDINLMKMISIRIIIRNNVTDQCGGGTMGAMSMQLENRVGNGVGVVLTVAVHVAAVVFLLSSRQQSEVGVPPIVARVISETHSTQAFEIPQAKPEFNAPKVNMALPDVSVAESSIPVAIAATPMAASASSSAPSQTVAQAADIVEPRFDADYLNNPAPAYPRVSRRLREQGVVLLRVYVLPNGLPEVVELKTSSGFSLLDGAALEAVRKWKFVPAQSGGRSIAAWVNVPIEFTLST